MEGKKTTGNNNKIVVCIEEYPSIKTEFDGNDSPTIKKEEKIYDLPQYNNLRADDVTSGNGMKDSGDGEDKGLENVFLSTDGAIIMKKFLYLEQQFSDIISIQNPAF